MEICVVAGECVEGAHLALALCRATHLGDVPTSLAGAKLIRAVHLISAGDALARLKRSPASVNGHTAGEGLLRLHETAASDASEVAWAERCSLIVLCTTPWEQDARLAWVAANAPLNGLVVALQHGALAAAAVQSALQAAKNQRNLVVLTGAITYACAFRDGDDSACATSLGAILLERLPRSAESRSLQLRALESASGVRVVYRSAKYNANWLFGASVWRSYDAYAALRFGSARPLSFYEQLCADAGTHRRAMTALIAEASQSLAPEERGQADPAGSPLGLGFRSALLLLRLPDPLFAPALHVCVLLGRAAHARSLSGRPHGGNASVVLRGADAVNGFFVEKAGAPEAVPLNALLVRLAAAQAESPRATPGAEFEVAVGKSGKSLLPLPVAMAGLLALLLAVFVLAPYAVLLAVNVLMPREHKFL